MIVGEPEAKGTRNGVKVEVRANSANGLNWLKLSHGQLLTCALLYNCLYWLFVEDSLKVTILLALHFSLSLSLSPFLSLLLSLSSISVSISASLIPHFFSASL